MKRNVILKQIQSKKDLVPVWKLTSIFEVFKPHICVSFIDSCYYDTALQSVAQIGLNAGGDCFKTKLFTSVFLVLQFLKPRERELVRVM